VLVFNFEVFNYFAMTTDVVDGINKEEQMSQLLFTAYLRRLLGCWI